MDYKRRKGIVYTALGLLMFSIWYFMLRPTYEFTYYKLADCPNLYLTKIVYWRLGERGVAFTVGRYSDRSLPKSEAFIDRNLSGFDAMYNVVVTCDDNKITINYNSGYYKPQGTTKIIFEKRVKAKEFDSLAYSHSDLHIVGY